MSEQIQTTETIVRQARRAVDAGKPITDCPYVQGSAFAKRWISAYLIREIELDDQREAA